MANQIEVQIFNNARFVCWIVKEEILEGSLNEKKVFVTAERKEGLAIASCIKIWGERTGEIYPFEKHSLRTSILFWRAI